MKKVCELMYLTKITNKVFEIVYEISLCWFETIATFLDDPIAPYIERYCFLHFDKSVGPSGGQ